MLTKPFHAKRWAGCILLAGGIVMVLGSIRYAIEATEFLHSTARVEGTVVSLKRERGARGLAMDHPVVRFVPPGSGETVEFKSRFGIWPSPFAVADRIQVAYDPADPVRARIDSFWTIWFLPLLLGVFGLACGAAGFQTLHQTQRVSRSGARPKQ